jgi:Helix-turn-helix domain
MTDDSDSPFLTIAEAALLLRVNRRTLDNLRWQNDGPPFRRHGGRIIYHRDEVLAWSKQRRARTPSTKASQEPPAEGSNGSQPCRFRDHLAESQSSGRPLEYQP